MVAKVKLCGHKDWCGLCPECDLDVSVDKNTGEISRHENPNIGRGCSAVGRSIWVTKEVEERGK